MTTSFIKRSRNEQENKSPSRLERYPAQIRSAFKGIAYVDARLKKTISDRKEIDDWKYVAMVIDRLLLWIFSFAFFFGTFGILLRAPSIYDKRLPYSITYITTLFLFKNHYRYIIYLRL